jgi:hypothetical protein
LTLTHATAFSYSIPTGDELHSLGTHYCRVSLSWYKTRISMRYYCTVHVCSYRCIIPHYLLSLAFPFTDWRAFQVLSGPFLVMRSLLLSPYYYYALLILKFDITCLFIGAPTTLR